MLTAKPDTMVFASETRPFDSESELGEVEILYCTIYDTSEWIYNMNIFAPSSWLPIDSVRSMP